MLQLRLGVVLLLLLVVAGGGQEEVVEEKTTFDVILEDVPSDKRVPVLKNYS